MTHLEDIPLHTHYFSLPHFVVSPQMLYFRDTGVAKMGINKFFEQNIQWLYGSSVSENGQADLLTTAADLTIMVSFVGSPFKVI